MLRTLTDLEVAALGQEYNLADGHAYRSWTAAEEELVGDLASRFRQVDRRQLADLEDAYFRTFFGLSRQTLDGTQFERFACFTASSGIELIANHLRLEGLSVALIEPCFDNVKDILRRHGVPLTVFPDAMLHADADILEAFLAGLGSDVLFLVSPNNPTGSVLGQGNFARILEHCARRGVTLVLDTCFRFYLAPDDVFDQYRMLIDSGINWIVIEDTGKTWPTLEIKAPFISVSRGLAGAMARINSDFLLHVSPFALALLTDFLRVSAADDCRAIRELVSLNRAVLNTALQPTILQPVTDGDGEPFMSLAWLKIRGHLTAGQLTRILGDGGVHVLPGNQFFWSDARLGDSYIRVALTRDPSMFAQAADRLADLCTHTRTQALTGPR